MKVVATIGLAFIFLALLAMNLDWVGAATSQSRARAVQVGYTRGQVEAMLGHPSKIFLPMPDARTNVIAAMLSVDTETWVYGSSIKLSKAFSSNFPYVRPGDAVCLRFFKPEADDVAIAFDASGRVSEIKIP